MVRHVNFTQKSSFSTTFHRIWHKFHSKAHRPNSKFDDIQATSCPSNERWSRRHFRNNFHRQQNLSEFFDRDLLRCSTQHRTDRRRRWKNVGELSSAKCLDSFCRSKCLESFCRPKRGLRRCSLTRIRRKIFRRLLTFDRRCFCDGGTDPRVKLDFNFKHFDGYSGSGF